MCVPRRAAANRPFSTSWGRSAFIFPGRQMEMNPVVTFSRACFDKQGVVSVKKSTQEKFNREIKYTNSVDKFFSDKKIDLLLLNKDATRVSEYLPKKSVDFILTDPPYGGLVQYLALSSIWTVWLEKIDASYALDFNSEITINDEIDFENYHRMLTKALTGAHEVLKKNRNLVITFHNDQINIWNSLLRAASVSGFEMEKIIYQPNRRTGESNVANPYGTSASDFYSHIVHYSLTVKRIQPIIVNMLKLSLIPQKKQLLIGVNRQITRFYSMEYMLSSRNMDISWKVLLMRFTAYCNNKSEQFLKFIQKQTNF